MEDHFSVRNPSGVKAIKDMINNIGLDYSTVGEVKLFSPYVGRTKMHIYKISDQNEKLN